MAKVRTTLTIEEELLRSVKVRAARTGKRDGEVIEEAVKSHLGLDVLERAWAANDMDEDEAMELALEAQREVRQERRAKR